MSTLTLPPPDESGDDCAATAPFPLRTDILCGRPLNVLRQAQIPRKWCASGQAGGEYMWKKSDSLLRQFGESPMHVLVYKSVVSAETESKDELINLMIN